LTCLFGGDIVDIGNERLYGSVNRKLEKRKRGENIQ
jgi:hypothetical protein